MEPEAAHDRIVQMLRLAQSNPLGRRVLHSIAGELPARPVKAFGLTFPNVVGVAAGFDKNVRVAPGLGELGFGHVEVGTLTPGPKRAIPVPGSSGCWRTRR